MNNQRRGKQYEGQIFDLLNKRFPFVKLEFDVKKLGHYSQEKRQIDVLAILPCFYGEIEVVIECKCYTEPVDVPVVDSFIGFLKDVRVDRGIIITNTGFTAAAQNRISELADNLCLKIIPVEELLKEDPTVGISYSENRAAFVRAPKNWIIHNQDLLNLGLHTILHRYELSIDSSYDREGFIYIGFWTKDQTASEVDELVKYQNKNILRWSDNAQIKVDKIRYKKKIYTLRCANIHNGYLGNEYTIYRDCEDFIIFAVLLEPACKQGKYVKFLKSVIHELFPISLHNPNNRDLMQQEQLIFQNAELGFELKLRKVGHYRWEIEDSTIPE